MELIGRPNRVLPGHRVGDEQDFLRIQHPLQRLHLVHQLIVDMQTAGGVNDQHIASRDDGLAPRLFRQTFNGGGVRFPDLSLVEIGLDRRRDHFQLLAGRGTIHVHRNQQRPVPAILQPVGELARGRRLAGTLEAGHQDDGRRLRGEL